MRVRKLVVVGLVGILTFAANIASAQEASAPADYAALDNVSFSDAQSDISSDRFRLNIGAGDDPRFNNFTPSPQRERTREGDTSYEVALVARSAGGFDVSLAQSGRVGFNDAGDIQRESSSSELRLGRGLQQMRDEPSAQPTWYVFAASEDEALIWRPGIRNSFGGASPGFALQDRVEIGDIQAGITYERYGIQASLAYVEREINVRSGSRTFSQDERFAGFTLTMRR